MSRAPDDTAIFLQAGKKRVFASALDWPGWARAGRTEELGVEALAAYLPRYAPVGRAAGLQPPSGDLVITERHDGLAKNADCGRGTAQIIDHVHGAEVMYGPAGLATPASGYPTQSGG